MRFFQETTQTPLARPPQQHLILHLGSLLQHACHVPADTGPSLWSPPSRKMQRTASVTVVSVTKAPSTDFHVRYTQQISVRSPEAHEDVFRKRHLTAPSRCLTINGQWCGAFQGLPVVKNPPANPEDVRDTSSIPGSGRSAGGGNGNPLQYFLEREMATHSSILNWRIPRTEEPGRLQYTGPLRVGHD